MKFYLDIDGVLLTKEGKEASHLIEFLSFATGKYDCYWLTTHCKGDVSPALEYMKDKVSKESFELLKKLKPTNWQTLKTDGIDFSKDFLWLDDYVMESEKEVLKNNNCLDKVILMDLKSNPDQLLSILTSVCT